jgi:Kef-type K+ transport system membrane component KefB
MSLASAALVSLLALLAPLVVRLIRLPVPDIVVQIGFGIVVGPQVLGWARIDEPVRVLSLIGLSFLLFLAGLELDFERLRGRVLRVAASSFGLSFVVALALGGLLGAAGLVKSPLLIAVILAATSVGIVIPILSDAGQVDTPLGRIVVAGGSLAEVIPVLLLSLLFSAQASDLGARITLLAAFCALVAAVALLIFGLERWRWIGRTLLALQDTTAQIRVRAAVALLMSFAALATGFGLEAILGSFGAGATISLLDRDRALTHQEFRTKLQAVGFGALIPFFFVATGMSLDVRSFVTDPATLARVPVFLAAILIARGLPALLYRPLLASRREVVIAGLLQATNLSIPVVGGSIGVGLGLIRPENYVALVAAGLVSVVAFPLIASALTGHNESEPEPRLRGPKARPANDAITAATTLSVPPYRNHLPGVVAVMITVPLATGMDSTNAAMIQPIPGSSAPLTEPIAHAASRQVSRMAAQQTSAATGTGVGTRPYWKLPIVPSTTPTMNSTP